ncbi:glycosyltransferase family 4 protein [Candidatus Bathyarchaeota archaeon]|nr:glycosyltransferase family 4 protein [Candidatus Bathyarchaeota archaeon]
MGGKAIIISRGLHPPWNMGEVVLARNFAKVLMRFYDDISVFSTIDEKRGPYDLPDVEQCFDIKYYRNEEELRVAVLNELNGKFHVDIHFINASLIRFLNVVRKAGRVYLYQFAYNILNNPNLIMRSVGALPLTYLGNVKIVTTALYSHDRLHRFFVRHYHYVPAPIDLPSHSEGSRTTNRPNSGLKVLYLGHGSYLRFPYDKILKALSRLEKEGYDIEFNIYVSELGYASYVEFVKDFKRAIEKLGLKNLVKLYLRNLSEAEKWRVIRENDVVLFPSLVNAAIDPPLIVLEAMFMGKCVIATPIQSIPHLLGRGRGIIVYRRNLEDGVYEALRTLEDNRTLLEEYGIRSKRWAAETYSMDTVYNRMREILNESRN